MFMGRWRAVCPIFDFTVWEEGCDKMLDALIRMMEEGEFGRCLHVAEQMMQTGGCSLAELATINLVICRSRLGIQDPSGAVAAGALAVKLAMETGDFDLAGRALLNLGTAYVGIRQYGEAIEQFETFLELLPRLRTARRLEGAIWKHIGVAHQRNLDSQKALEALTRARDWFRQQGVDYAAFTCTHDLINTHLHLHDTEPFHGLEPVKFLLVEMKVIAKRHPEDGYYQGTYLLDLAATYLRDGRLDRATVTAHRAMAAHRGDPSHAFHCQLILHHCALEVGNARRALDYALAARSQASAARLYDLESLAAQAIGDLIRQQEPEVARQLDEEYLAIGVDLGKYLSPLILGREAH